MIDLDSSQETKVEKKTTFPDVLISLDGKTFSISAKYVNSMELLTTVTSIPQSPNFLRGMIRYRNKLVPLIDLRIKLGMVSLIDQMNELSHLFIERRKDHEHWLNVLEESVYKNKKFTLTTDPHQCKFGMWYDHFETNNPTFVRLLKKFDAPHKKIHSIAEKVQEKLKQGYQEEAIKIIEKTRSTALNEMSRLFEKAANIAYEDNNEIIVIIGVNDTLLGLTVDTVISVEYLKEETIQKIDVSEKAIATKIARRTQNDQPVVILDPNRIDFNSIQSFIIEEAQ
jgi:purine-binding chemotaxis protein CheW